MKAKPIRLYDYQFSGNGYKIRLALAQLGLEVDVVNLDLLKGETWTTEFFAKNPMGQIPVLELEDAKFLRESNSILYYLSQSTHLMPTDLMGQTEALQWMFFEQSNIDKVLGRARFLKAFPDFRETTNGEWEEWYRVGNKALKVVDDHLRKTNFLVSNTYSLADICLFGYVHTANEGGFQLENYPSIQKWLENVKTTPGFIPQCE